MNEIIKDIGGIVGSLITIITFLSIIIKPFRNAIVNWIKSIGKTEKIAKNEKKLNEIKDTLANFVTESKRQSELQNEALLSLIRDNITSIYYKGLTAKTIKVFDKEALIKKFSIYSSMGGNSYIHEIYEEMMTWNVIQ